MNKEIRGTLFVSVGPNIFTHLILVVEPGGFIQDEVLHNNYASVPITVAESPSSEFHPPPLGGHMLAVQTKNSAWDDVHVMSTKAMKAKEKVFG